MPPELLWGSEVDLTALDELHSMPVSWGLKVMRAASASLKT